MSWFARDHAASQRLTAGVAAAVAGLLLFCSSAVTWFGYHGGGPYISQAWFAGYPEAPWRGLLIFSGGVSLLALATVLSGSMARLGAIVAMVGVALAGVCTTAILTGRFQDVHELGGNAVTDQPGELLAPLAVLLLLIAAIASALSGRRPIPTTARADD